MLPGDRPAKWIFASHLPFWLVWAVASTVAGLLGWSIIALTSIVSFGITLMFSGVAVGLLVGWAQQRALSGRYGSSGWPRWAPLTLVGFSMAWFVILGLGLLIGTATRILSIAALDWDLLSPPVLFLAGGFILGLIQYRAILPGGSKQAWVVLNALGWAVIGPAALLLTDILLGGFREGTLISIPQVGYIFLAGSIAMCLYGILSGVAVSKLLAR